jgi:hypothetical protein
MPSPVNNWLGTFLRPWHTFILGGPSARPQSTTIEFSLDTISARAQCKFPGSDNPFSSTFPAVDINQHCWLQGGYRDAFSAESSELLFEGWIEEDLSGYTKGSLANTISLGDRLHLTQYTLGDPFYDQSPFNMVAVYDGTSIAIFDGLGNPTGTVASPTNNAPDSGWTDIAIVRDLLVKAGVASSTSDPVLQGVGGLGVIMAQQQGIVLTNQQQPADLISQIDQATGCKTFAAAAGPQRIVTTFSPTTTPAWTLSEGSNIFQIENKRSLKNFYNRVVVKGLQLGGAQWISIRKANPNLPAVGGGSPLQLPYNRNSSSPITYVFSSDLVQSQDHADRLSNSLLTVGNRVERRITVTTNFNPYARPGQTVGVFAPHAKIYSTVNGFVYGVKHSFDSGGAKTAWDVAIYDGVTGDTIAPPASVAILPAQVSRFTDADGVVFYTVSLDATGSWSTSFTPDQLSFAWTDNFGDTGTLPTFSFTVSSAQLGGAVGTTVNLVVTDPNGTSVSAQSVVSFV